MSNRYAGTCTRCHRTVPAGQGTCTRTATGWAVQHASCTAAAPTTGWSYASARRGLGPGPATLGTCHDCGGALTQMDINCASIPGYHIDCA